MMRPCVLLLLASSALLCCVNARQVAFVGASLPNQIRPSQFLSSPSSSSSHKDVAKCYGLARKTRTQSLKVPVLYNSVSGQTAAVPDYLSSLDDKTIDMMEAEGWEVRMKTIMMPETFYQRVPVCCPWDTACYHNQQRGLQMAMAQSASRTSPCMNGGILVPRGGIQVCICPSEYQGVWCQTPTMMTSSFPSGPVIPYGRGVPSTADVLRQAVKQAQMWKEKMMSNNQSPVAFVGRPMTKGPLLSPNDHLITSMNKHWARQTPSDKALRMKMAMLLNLYLKQQGGRIPPMMMAPIFKTKDTRTNPYSSSKPLVNPQMMSMINHLQGRGMPAPVSPYGQPLLPVQTYGRGNMAGNQGMNVPQARTPWDMDPWDRQRGNGGGQAMMGGPSMAVGRDKLIALAFKQYMQNIQRRMAAAQASGRGGLMRPNMVPQINRVLIREPPMTDVDYPQNPTTMDAVNNNLPSYQSDQASGAMDGTNQMTDKEMTSVELPAAGRGDDSRPSLTQDNRPMTGQGMSQVIDNGPINAQKMPMGGMNGQMMPQGMNPLNGQMLQGMPMGAGGPMAAGGQMPRMPSQEELQRMTECRVVLEPRITMCINDAGHDITLEQFMNPQYMSKAKGVCDDSESVGQCVMRQDQACGQGASVDMTRKMIDSVLQMMGMVCGQIIKIEQQRGSHVPSIPGMPQGNSPSLTTIPQGINIRTQTDMPVGEAPSETTIQTDSVRIDASGHSKPPSKSSDKFTTSRIGGAVTERAPSKAASKTDRGHHSVEPVTSDSFIPGAPLWIVILVASIILLISCLSLVLIALAVRKRRGEKSKVIECKAEPMDPKLYTIGLPPPHYAIASIKTQDELNLPPLDLAEDAEKSADSVSGKEESDGGEEEEEDEDVKKTAVSDDDADDESDDKEENNVDKKKKEKKDKK